jgi:hypothetical protein
MPHWCISTVADLQNGNEGGFHRVEFEQRQVGFAGFGQSPACRLGCDEYLGATQATSQKASVLTARRRKEPGSARVRSVRELCGRIGPPGQRWKSAAERPGGAGGQPILVTPGHGGRLASAGKRLILCLPRPAVDQWQWRLTGWAAPGQRDGPPDAGLAILQLAILQLLHNSLAVKIDLAMKYIATRGFVQGLKNPLKTPDGSKHISEGMIFSIDEEERKNQDIQTFINGGYIVELESERGKQTQVEVAKDDNIRNYSTERIESMLKTQSLQSAVTQMLLDEMGRRDELEAAAKSAEDLLNQNAIHHAKILAQNQTHHENILAQNEKHHGDTLAEFRGANASIRRANKVAEWAIVVSFIAVILAALLPFVLESHFTKDRQPSSTWQPTQESQQHSVQGTNGSAGIASPSPISKPTATTNTLPETNKTAPQSTNSQPTSYIIKP